MSVRHRVVDADGDRAVRFIEQLCHHVKGEWAGRNFLLEPWQKEITRQIFGTKRPDGLRQYRKVYIEVPRKNGKSSWGAALALYLLFGDGEDGAEVYSAAADRDQAAIIFDMARRMVELEPILAEKAKLYRRAIVYQARGSAYHVLSADAPTKHGKNSHGIIFDELHAQPNRDLYDVLNTSTGARREPLIIMLTTAGFDRSSICWEIHDYATKVRDGVLQDDSFLPVIYKADEDEDWTEPKVWRKANPNYDVSLKSTYLEQECNAAKESPSSQNTFRRLHLNQWTEQDVRWLDMAVWDRCGGAVDADSLEGFPCFAGIDLASTTDVAALTLLFPLADGTYEVLPYFWVPEESAKRRTRKDRVQYDTWISQGWMTATQGDVIDYDVIREHVNKLGERFEILEVPIDHWNSTQLQTQLIGDGFEVAAFGQGFASMSAPTKELEGLLLSGRIRHGNHPVLTWMAANVAVEQDAAGNLKPSKKRSTEKIDGIVALIMALGRAMVKPTEEVYDGELVTVEV